MPNAPDLTCSIILIFPKESINARIFSVGPVSSIVYVVSVTSIILALKISVSRFNSSLCLREDLLLVKASLFLCVFHLLNLLR